MTALWLVAVPCPPRSLWVIYSMSVVAVCYVYACRRLAREERENDPRNGDENVTASH